MKQDWAHSFVTAVAAGGVCLMMRWCFINWSGLRSIDQHRQSQKHEKPQLLSEEARTWHQLLIGKPLPPPYDPPPFSPDMRPLEPAIDPVDAWKDRARELV